MFRSCIVKRMEQLQESFGKIGGKGIISEADEASISSGPVSTPSQSLLRFSYTRIIALLVRGSRQLIIQKLPETIQKYRLKGKQKIMSGGTIYFNKKKYVPPGPPRTTPKSNVRTVSLALAVTSFGFSTPLN